MARHLPTFIISLSAVVLGALIAQYLVNNVTSVRRTVGGI